MTSGSLRSLAIVAALTLMAGCSSSPDASPTTTTPTTTTPTTTPQTTTSTTSTTTTSSTTATTEPTTAITADQLMADVRILTATPRSTEAQRETTRVWLQHQLEASGYDVHRWTRADTSQSPAVPVNLVARLAGTASPERVLIVSAHYDSVEGVVGADDDASGVAAVLAVARALATAHPKLGATIEFVFFDLEELGLLGSRAYVAEGIVGRTIIGVINLESVGYTCGEGCQPVFTDIPGCLTVGGEVHAKGDNIVAVGDETATDLMVALTAAARRVAPDRALGTGLVAGNGTCMSVTRRSDHAPFWDAGIPAVMVTDLAEYRNTNYHRSTDVADTLDPAFLLDVTRTVAAAALLAAGPD